MPRGTYRLTGHDGPYALERFACGPGPLGWRYVATREQPATGAPLGRLDVVLDARGAALRVEVQAGGWRLRGGVVGGEVLWRRGTQEHAVPGEGFTGTSPVWAVAGGRLLAASGTGPVRLRLVRLGDEALATRQVEEGWAGTPARCEAADLSTGERRVALVDPTGVVLEATGVELLDVEP